MEGMKLQRAYSVTDVLRSRHTLLDYFDNEWRDLIGIPSRSGAWMIWGNSGNGKTSFLLQLAKYMCKYEKVLYNSLEEGNRHSMQLAYRRNNMESVGRRLLLVSESIDHMEMRLKMGKSPNVVIVDSLQYSGLNKAAYKKLLKDYPNKLFIFNSHADGKQPDGRAARSIRYDVDVKIWIEGYKAFAVSRFGGGKPFTIWEQGALRYWSKHNKNNDNENDSTE